MPHHKVFLFLFMDFVNEYLAQQKDAPKKNVRAEFDAPRVICEYWRVHFPLRNKLRRVGG